MKNLRVERLLIVGLFLLLCSGCLKMTGQREFYPSSTPLEFKPPFVGSIGDGSAPSGTSTGNALIGSTADGTSTGNPGQSKLTYQAVAEAVFYPQCLSCHNNVNRAGGVKYDTYLATVRRGHLIGLASDYRHYREPNEACAKISIPEMDMVREWIEAGAPR